MIEERLQIRNEAHRNHNSVCVLIMGVQRSGLGALAGCMRLLGVNIGLQQKLLFNSDETVETSLNSITLIHDILCRDLGWRWDMVGSLPQGWCEGKSATEAAKKLKPLIEQELGKDEPWAVVDPRLIKLIPLWENLLSEMQIEPRFLHIVRHPHEVACSLNALNGMEISKGQLLWATNFRDAIRKCNAQYYDLLAYDQLLADPVGSMKFLEKSLNFNFPSNPLRHADQLIQFARPELKHHLRSNAHFEGADSILWISHLQRIYENFLLEKSSLKNEVALTAKILSSDELTKNEKVNSQFSMPLNADPRFETKTAIDIDAALLDKVLEVVGIYEQNQLEQLLEERRRLIMADHDNEILYSQIFFPVDISNTGGECCEHQSERVLIAPQEWQKISISVSRPESLKVFPLRIKPLNTRGVVYVAHIKLIHPVSGDIFWETVESRDFEKCKVSGDAMVLACSDDGLQVVCTGDAPMIEMPIFHEIPDCPMEFSMWIKATRKQTAIHKFWFELNRSHRLMTEGIKKEQIALEDARSKIAQLEQDSETLKNQHRLHTNTLKEELLENKTRIEALENSARQLEINIQEQENEKALIEKQLAELKMLSRQYYTELIASENALFNTSTQLTATKRRIVVLQQNNRQLVQWMVSLRKNHRALELSRRWRIGNFFGSIFDLLIFRRKPTLAVGNMSNIFEKFQKYQDHSDNTDTSTNNTVNMNNSAIDSKGKWIANALKQQNEHFLSLMQSNRWKFGNLFVRFFEILLLRSAVPLAIDHMETVFEQYNEWLNKNKLNEPKNNFTYSEIEQMNAWMRKLYSNFNALIGSRRWRYGNALGRICRKFTFRPINLLSTDHMELIFDEWKKKFK